MENATVTALLILILALVVAILIKVFGESKPEPTSKNNGALEDVVDE